MKNYMAFNNTLYIVLAIAWIIYSFYKKSNKNKTQSVKQTAIPEEQTTATPDNINLKSLFNEILQGNIMEDNKIYKEENVKSIEYEHPKVSQKEVISNENLINKEGASKIDKSIKYIRPKNVYETKIPKKVSSYEYIDFDIRKAIIYSEIINNPYQKKKYEY